MDRADAILLGWLLGLGTAFAGLGVCQWLISIGYNIAANLAGAGYSYQEIKAHKKLAIVMPWVMKARSKGDSER